MRLQNSPSITAAHFLMQGPFTYVNDLPDTVQHALKKEGSEVASELAAALNDNSDEAELTGEDEASRLLQLVMKVSACAHLEYFSQTYLLL